MMRRLTILPLFLACLGLSPVVPAPKAAEVEGPLALYDYTMKVVTENFDDKSMHGLKWDEMVQGTRRQLGPKPTDEQVRAAVDSLLGQLQPAHARLLGADQQEYWALTSVFSNRLDGGRLRQIGAWFERRGKRWFVSQVFAGSPAERAGLLRGDEIVAVDGNPLQPVEAFTRLRPTEKAAVAYRRTPWEKPRTVQVETVVESFQETMLRSLTKSRTLSEVKGKKIAYVALPSATHADFRVALAAAAKQAEAEADALVLDLRGTYGGADLAYLEPFFAMPPPKDHPEAKPTPALFSKPLVALVDGGTRSGKEWLAWLIKQQKRGPLVGARTAGAFLAGRAFEIVPRKYLLYLAVADAKAPQGSIEPDVPMDETLMFAAGQDAARKQAMETAAGLVK